MKKFIFVLVVSFWALLLIGISFLVEKPPIADKPLSVDMSEGEKLYRWDSNAKTFTQTSLTGSKIESGDFYYHRFSPVDGIYYKSDDIRPFTLSKKEGTNNITFGSGIFICNIQTGIEKYTFHVNDIVFTPKSRGVFLVDTTHIGTTILPLDTFLDIEILEAWKERVVSFTLFPSLLFTHDQSHNTELKDVDILRMSVIDSIRFVDLQNAEDRKIIFSWENAGWDEVFFTKVQDDITSRIKALASVYTAIIEQDDKKIQNISFFDASSSLFINNSKKAILLKNMLIESIVNAIRTSNKWQSTAIAEILSQMKELDTWVYNEGLAIVKKYYSIALFSYAAQKDGVIDFWAWSSPFVQFVESTINTGPREKQRGYSRELGKIFWAYYFLSLKTEDLNHAFENSLRKILESKTLSKDEFLPFTFFVTQYLSNGSIVPDEYTLYIISHLIEITNQYYADNQTDDSKIGSITSTIFYNYNKIFTKLRSVFIITFTNNETSGSLTFKNEYIKGGELVISQSLKDAFIKLISLVKTDMLNKQKVLSWKNLYRWDSQVITNFFSLSRTIEWFNTLVLMLTNYQSYLHSSKLDWEDQIEGIVITKWYELSREKLENYLKNFNNLDIASLNLINQNELVKDGFYRVQVNILSNIFTFKLTEENHFISEISYKDAMWTEHTFPNIPVNLDKRQETLEKELQSSDDPEMKFKKDFKNYFEVTFIKKDEEQLVGPEPEPLPTPTSTGVINDEHEIAIFIQNKLLDGDFKNTEKFLPIGFRDIKVSVIEWTYLIELHNLKKSFKGENDTYFLEIESKYIFNRHTFSRLTFRVKKEGDKEWFDFNDTVIELLPARLSIFTFQDSVKDLGYYIDTIKSSYTNQKSIIVDLAEKKVLLDNIPFIPKFPVK
jgi:hypothetical protein